MDVGQDSHSRTTAVASQEVDLDPALVMDALQKLDDGRLTLETPPDPRAGAATIALDPLEWIHRITAHIRDPGRHCQCFCGACCNRRRVVKARLEGDGVDAAADSRVDRDNAESSREARSTWARLIRTIFEADPLACS